MVRKLAQLSPMIGDDCSVFTPPPGRDLVFTTDMLIEDVHFECATHTAREIGRKALARGLSDIAAMGADAEFCLVSLALPKWAHGRFFNDFYDGLLKLAHEHGCTLAGGDLAHVEKLVCDIVVCGSVPKGAALRRSGASAGDFIHVSGPLGASALGLRTRKGAAWKRHRNPEPRLDVGRSLRGVATACMDLSDGLSIDLSRLCEASGIGAEISDVPLWRGATIEDALHGGEDYELLFTARTPLDYPSIGRVVKGSGVKFQGRKLEALGYDHFRR